MKARLTPNDVHKPEYFRRHCEIVEYLLQLPDLENPAVKHHLRSAIREASHHASRGPGYDNKKGAQYMSVKAREQMERGDFRGLVGDHIVPVSILNAKIVSDPAPSHKKIATILLECGQRAVITKEEDEMLKQRQLRKKMPTGWNERDVFARYKPVGIEIEPSRYLELSKRRE